MWILIIGFLILYGLAKLFNLLSEEPTSYSIECSRPMGSEPPTPGPETNPIIRGHIFEQQAPLLKFPEDMRDARFIGGPVDYVIFKNCSKGGPVEILFVEVKSGSSNLSKREELIKEAVLNKRVKWLEVRRS